MGTPADQAHAPGMSVEGQLGIEMRGPMRKDWFNTLGFAAYAHWAQHHRGFPESTYWQGWSGHSSTWWTTVLCGG